MLALTCRSVLAEAVLAGRKYPARFVDTPLPSRGLCGEVLATSCLLMPAAEICALQEALYHVFSSRTAVVGPDAPTRSALERVGLQPLVDQIVSYVAFNVVVGDTVDVLDYKWLWYSCTVLAIFICPSPQAQNGRSPSRTSQAPRSKKRLADNTRREPPQGCHRAKQWRKGFEDKWDERVSAPLLAPSGTYCTRNMVIPPAREELIRAVFAYRSRLRPLEQRLSGINVCAVWTAWCQQGWCDVVSRKTDTAVDEESVKRAYALASTLPQDAVFGVPGHVVYTHTLNTPADAYVLVAAHHSNCLDSTFIDDTNVYSRAKAHYVCSLCDKLIKRCAAHRRERDE